MSKSPIPAPRSIDELLSLASLSPSAKLLCILLVRRSKTAPLRAEQKYDVDEVSLACGLAVDDGRHAARELHRADFADLDGKQVRLINGSDVTTILDGTSIERATEDVVVQTTKDKLVAGILDGEVVAAEETDAPPANPLEDIGPNNTVAEITGALEAFGVKVPQGTKKADLLALLQDAKVSK